MPNCLLQPATSQQSIVRCPLQDPMSERINRRRFGRAAIPNLDLANSLYVASGRWPARAWILLRRGDYNKINPYRTDLQLLIEDVQHSDLALKFFGMTVVQAQCVSRGVNADPNAIYLVELTDARGIYVNEWWEQPTLGEYNIRAPAYPQQYYSSSLFSGSPWTWDGMLGDLWGQMSGLGTYPGLPISPTEDVEGFALPGCGAFAALNDAIEQLGCCLAADLLQTGPTDRYFIADPGVADPAFEASLAKYAHLKQDDLEYIDLGSGRVPSQVVCLFHRRNEYYGTEETIRRDSLQWTSTPFYTVTVSAPVQYSQAVGTATLWCEFTVRYDTDGSPLAADVVVATAIASERATQFYTKITRGTLGFLHRVYAGTLPFATGTQVDGVCWRQDGRDGRAGWTTEIIRGAWPAWEQVEMRPRRAGW